MPKETPAQRLKRFASEGATPPQKPARKRAGKVRGLDEIDTAPPIGQRGDFVKIALTVPPEINQALLERVYSAKMGGQKGVNVSVIIRDALVEYLKTD